MRQIDTICYKHNMIGDCLNSLKAAAETIIQEINDVRAYLDKAIMDGQKMEDAIRERNKKIEELENEILDLQRVANL